MIKQKKQTHGFSAMGIMDCKECETEEDWAEMNRKHRRSRGMLEW